MTSSDQPDGTGSASRTGSDGADYLAANRERWGRWAADYVATGERLWQPEVAAAPTWGVWGATEEELRLLDGVDGADCVELGCGSAYVSAWIARRGGRPVGIDPTAEQLATATRLQAEHGLHFPLVQAAGEALPFPDASFDVAISEYGAALWADPRRWVPEAARVLRPGGRLVFLTTSPWAIVCGPDVAAGPEASAVDHMLRPYFGLHRVDWESDGSTEFVLPHSRWFALLQSCGFEVLGFHEIQAPADANSGYDYVSAAWAHRWPSEDVWVARRR